MMTKQKSWKRKGFILAFLAPTLIAFAVFYLYLILTVLFTSFCKWDYTNITSPEFFGFKDMWNNYNYIFKMYPYFWEALRNSSIWALLGVFVQIPIATFIALALSRKVRGIKLHIYNTRGALIFIYACSGIALSFFVIKNYYANIPHELEEAARIDGCGYAMTWWKVIFPIARPGIMTAAVLAFLNNWNEYYWASLVIVDREKLTVPALLSTFTTSFRTNYNGLFSAMVVIILPPIILYCVFSKFFVEALSGGAVKG